MSVPQLFKGGMRLLRERGVRDTFHEVRSFLREAILRQYHQFTGKAERGTPIYERDWDLLVVLDACRADFLQEIASEYDFLDDVGEAESVGSYSLSWMEGNFSEEYSDEMAETVHVSGNPFTETALDPNDFQHLEEVWRYSWDKEIGTLRPRPITDAAVSLAREENPERLIVHYMQPHEPFTTHPELRTGPSAENWADTADKSVWQQVLEGKIQLEDAKKAYRDELAMVLDEVGLLLNSVDAETAVVTADHGEAMGESGFFGHPRGVAIDALRVVPWARTTANDSGEHSPENHRSESDGEQTERLRDLGYLE